MKQTHWVYGSGSPGCLYDNGPNYAESKRDAINALAFTFDHLGSNAIRRMRSDLHRYGLHYFGKDAAEAGAGFCEVSKQDGPCPENDE